MLPGANVQIARLPIGAQLPSSIAWAQAQWIDTECRQPSLLAELGIPLRCFHPDRGYFFACFLPERGWYWADGASAIQPERWAAPLPRRGQRLAAF